MERGRPRLKRLELRLDRRSRDDVRVRTCLKEHFESLKLKVWISPQKRCHIVLADRIDIGTLINQLLHPFKIINFDRLAKFDHAWIGEIVVGFPAKFGVPTIFRDKLPLDSMKNRSFSYLCSLILQCVYGGGIRMKSSFPFLQLDQSFLVARVAE